MSTSENYVKKLNIIYLRKKPVLKTKLKGLNKLSGRNNSGKITVYHKGGGHKRKYRKIKFDRTNASVGICCTMEYDPNRNAHIASIFDFQNSSFFYMISPKHLKIGDIVESGPDVEPKLGNSLPLSKIPIGSYIYNISTGKSKKSKFSRSAGAFSVVKEKKVDSSLIELSSRKHKFVPLNSFATIGIVSNEMSFLNQLDKAGQSRWLNKRPTVRGVAMNPVDHPHGGGEGKKSGLNKTPWGKPNNKSKSYINIDIDIDINE